MVSCLIFLFSLSLSLYTLFLWLISLTVSLRHCDNCINIPLPSKLGVKEMNATNEDNFVIMPNFHLI